MGSWRWRFHAPVDGGGDPFALLDGRAGATGAAAQLPNILDIFHRAGVSDGRYKWPTLASAYSNTSALQQPGWLVAGVDFAVAQYSNCTINTSTGVITETGPQSTPTNGQKKSLRTINGGTLPTVNGSTISQGTQYFVVNASGSTYKLALTSGGSAVTFGGSPSGVMALKVPQSTTSMPPGVASNSGTISINGNSAASNGNQSTTGPIVLDSYDFAEQYVYCTYGSNSTSIRNSYFSSISSASPCVQTDPPCNAINIRYCEFNGGGIENVGVSANGVVKYVLSLLGAAGTVEYNYIHNVSTEVIAHTSNSAFQYNLVADCGYGDDGDHLEMSSGQPGYSNYVMKYNTFYQPPAVGGYPKEQNTGMVYFQTPAAVVSTNITVDSNVFIGMGPNTHRSSNGVSNHPAFNMGIYFSTGNGGSSTNTISITKNYINSSSMETLGLMIFLEGPITNTTLSENISLSTGATINPATVGAQ